MNWIPSFLRRKVKDSPYKTHLLQAIAVLVGKYQTSSIIHTTAECPLCRICTVGYARTQFPIVDCSRCPNMAFHDKRVDLPHDWAEGWVERPCTQRWKIQPKLDYSVPSNEPRLAIFWGEVYTQIANTPDKELNAYQEPLRSAILNIAQKVCEA